MKSLKKIQLKGLNPVKLNDSQMKKVIGGSGSSPEKACEKIAVVDLVLIK